MENKITSNWYLVLIKGIIMILLSMMVFSRPAGALLAFALYIGIALIATGFTILFHGISLKRANSNTNWGWAVFEGLLDIFLGYVLLTNPLVTAEVLPWMFGFWAVFYGILLIISSFSGDGNGGWTKMLSGILMIIIGNIIMHNPLFAGMSLVIWVGILLMIAGVFNVIISFSLKKA